MKRIYIIVAIILALSITSFGQEASKGLSCSEPTSILEQSDIQEAKNLFNNPTNKLGFTPKCLQIEWESVVLKINQPTQEDMIEAERIRRKTQSRAYENQGLGNIAIDVMIIELGRLGRIGRYGGAVGGVILGRRVEDRTTDILLNGEAAAFRFLNSKWYRISRVVAKVTVLVPGKGLQGYFVEFMGMTYLADNSSYIYDESAGKWLPVLNYDKMMRLGAVQSAINLIKTPNSN